MDLGVFIGMVGRMAGGKEGKMTGRQAGINQASTYEMCCLLSLEEACEMRGSEILADCINAAKREGSIICNPCVVRPAVSCMY